MLKKLLVALAAVVVFSATGANASVSLKIESAEQAQARGAKDAAISMLTTGFTGMKLRSAFGTPKHTSNLRLVADSNDAINRMIAWQAPENPHPKVEGAFVTFIASSLLGCLCAPLWLPGVMQGGAPQGDYLMEVVLTTLLHMGVSILAGATGVGAIFSFVDMLYLYPMALWNVYDYAYKQGGKGRKSAAKDWIAPDVQHAMAY